MSGVKLDDLLQETAEAEVHVGNKTVHLVYKVLWEDVFKEDDWNEIKELPGREFFARFLPRIIQQWDLVDSDEQPVPVTAEAIEQHDIPVKFLRMCLDALTGDLQAGKVSANGSRAG